MTPATITHHARCPHWPPPADEHLSSVQVCQEVGISYRQLDHWVRAGYLHPQLGMPNPGSGTARCFTRRDVTRLHAIRRAIEQAGAVLQEAGLPSSLVRYGR